LTDDTLIPSFRAICLGVKFNARKFMISSCSVAVIIYYFLQTNGSRNIKPKLAFISYFTVAFSQNWITYSIVALVCDFQLQQAQKFFFQSRQISTVHLPQHLQKPLHRFLQCARIHSTHAIANHLHLLTFRRQIVA